MLESGKQYIVVVNADREEDSVLHVREVVFSSKRNGVEYFELDTNEYAKNITISEDDIIDYEEVTDGQLYSQDLTFDELVHQMVLVIKRRENKIGGEEDYFSLFTTMDSQLKIYYGVTDYEDRREIYHEAYNRTHDRQIEYKSKN